MEASLSIKKLSQRIVDLQSDTIICEGIISVEIEDGVMIIEYNRDGICVRMIRDINNKEVCRVKKEIRDFIVDIYYEYERDGSPMTMDEMCGIIGATNRNTVREEIRGIMRKLKVNYYKTLSQT